jgi:hypothetical protein
MGRIILAIWYTAGLLLDLEVVRDQQFFGSEILVDGWIASGA